MVDRDLHRRAGAVGLLGTDIDEQCGGGVDDFRYNVVINEELTRVGAMSVTMNICGFNNLVAPYLAAVHPGAEARWLLGRARGSGSARSPDGAGDRQRLRRDHDDGASRRIRLRAQRGQNVYQQRHPADVVIVAAKSDPQAGARGISLLVVESGMPGLPFFRRRRHA